MKTLIELYDERPIENVLATEMFRPEETVMLCPPEVVSDKALKETLSRYFEHRGCPVKLTTVAVSLLDAAKVDGFLRKGPEFWRQCAASSHRQARPDAAEKMLLLIEKNL